MESFVLVITTCSDKNQASTLADLVVRARLAACGNIVDAVSSFFHWKGDLCRESEAMLLFKTQAKHLDRLVRFIQEHHSYKVPEIIALPIAGGAQNYLKWIEDETESL